MTVVFIDKLHRTRQIWQVENEQYLPRDDHVTQCQREAGPTYLLRLIIHQILRAHLWLQCGQPNNEGLCMHGENWFSLSLTIKLYNSHKVLYNYITIKLYNSLICAAQTTHDKSRIHIHFNKQNFKYSTRIWYYSANNNYTYPAIFAPGLINSNSSTPTWLLSCLVTKTLVVCTENTEQTNILTCFEPPAYDDTPWNLDSIAKQTAALTIESKWSYFNYISPACDLGLGINDGKTILLQVMMMHTVLSLSCIYLLINF